MATRTARQRPKSTATQTSVITKHNGAKQTLSESEDLYLLVDGDQKPLFAGQTDNLLGLITELFADGDHCIWSHGASQFFTEEVADEAERRRRESEMIQNLQPVCN